MPEREAEQPRVLSLTPGRVRVSLPGWTGDRPEQVEARLRRLPGVEAVQANPLTCNVLIRFDPNRTGHEPLLSALRPEPDPPARQGRGLSASPWLRVGVRGVLGHAVVDSLWFGAGFLGRSLGLPLGALGPLHLLLDVLVWGAALASAEGGGAPRAVASGNTVR
jgi:hypothetical protein